MQNNKHVMKERSDVSQQNRHSRRGQRGGGSDWSHSFYAYYMSPAELSRYTLEYIDRAPMFNPLEFNTIIPTGTSGITPTGVYLANHPSAQIKSKDYDKSAIQATACGGTNQKGGSYDYSFYHPSCYPGTTPYTPDYIGVTCGDGNGSLERCRVHYSATSSAGLGCNVCDNGQHGQQFEQRRKDMYQWLMGLDQGKILGLCKDNHIRIFDMDQETGRMTPRNKDKLCNRLVKTAMKSGQTLWV